MFRRFLDQVKNLNTQKLKKDSEINLKKFEFYFKDQVKDLKQKTEKLGLKQKLESTKNLLIQNLNTQKLKKGSEFNLKKFEFYFKDQVKDLKQKTEKLGWKQKLENTKNLLIQNLNTQKLKKDSEINLKRFEFCFKDRVKDLKQKTEKLGLKQKLESTKKLLIQKRKEWNLRKLDDLKTKKIDEWNYKFEEKVKEGFKAMKKMIYKSKDAPKVVKDQGKNVGMEVKDFFKENYLMTKNHLKQYFKDNEKFFKYKIEAYRSRYRKKKMNMLIIGGLAIFVYAAGANLPYAIAKYKLSQEMMEIKKAKEEGPAPAQRSIELNESLNAANLDSMTVQPITVQSIKIVEVNGASIS